MHPNLETQAYTKSHGGALPAAFSGEGFGDIDGTPYAVAAFVAGAAVALLLLKAAGFRFNFGVGAKVG